MNKHQWKTYYRNWRCVQSILYVDESPIPYSRRLHIEKHFKLAKDCRPYYDSPSKLLYMWEIGQRVRARAIEENVKFNPACVANAARIYMRSNSKGSGRISARESYPCSWSQFDTV